MFYFIKLPTQHFVAAIIHVNDQYVSINCINYNCIEHLVLLPSYWQDYPRSGSVQYSRRVVSNR